MRYAILVLAFLTLAGCTTTASRETSDYLDADLRKRVDALKRTITSAPTNKENQLDRALLLYDWINAWSRSGGYVPVNATTVASMVAGYGIPAGPVLDAYVAELAILDEEPTAVGELTASPTGPFTVKTPATFTQTWTAGSRGMRAGGGVLVAKHFQANHPPFQAKDSAADNYVSITSSNPDAVFETTAANVAGMHGGFRGGTDQLTFRLVEGELAPGDTITVTYGDTSGGGRGLVMPDFVSDQMPFPLYVDIDGSHLWLSLPIQPIRTIGTHIHAVTGFAPSILAPGETFELTIRAEDAWGNLATGEIPEWEIWSADQRLTTVTSGNALSTAALTFDDAGVYRLQVRAKNGDITGEVNPVLVTPEPRERIYWGDTHGHSGFAEGIGTADAYMAFARDQAKLDFVTHSEHDIWMDDNEWETLRRLVTEYTEDGRFAAYLGYEWTIRQSQGGHHNVLYRSPEGRDRVPSQRYPTLSRLYQGLRERYDTVDVLIIPHAHQRGEYRMSDPEMETLVEIMSMHGTFEWFGRMYLKHGHEVGFVAASDDHIGRPGYAQPKSLSLAQRGGLGAIFAPEKTADAIFDGMKALRTYATSGQRMILDFSVNDAPMGTRAKAAPERAVKARIIGTAPIRSVTLFRNDEVLKEWQYVEDSSERIAVTFGSESHPYHPQDNPRGWRHWRGTLNVSGVSLKGAELVDHHNPWTQRLETDGNAVSFATHTRGDHSTIYLDVTGDVADMTVTLDLEDARETGSGPPTQRRHQLIAGQRLSMGAGDVLSVGIDGYEDTVRLDPAGDAPLEVSLDITDNEDTRNGDYYFIRVRQVDEGLGWSSPVWVGGFPTR